MRQLARHRQRERAASREQVGHAPRAVHARAQGRAYGVLALDRGLQEDMGRRLHRDAVEADDRAAMQRDERRDEQDRGGDGGRQRTAERGDHGA